MKYKAILFDLDGTLLYTLEDLMIAVNETLKEYSYPIRTLEEIRRAVGNGNRRLLARSLPDGENNPYFEEIFQKYVSYYFSHDTVTTRSYEGVDKVLSYCRKHQIKTGVITNKLHTAAVNLMEHYFPGQFDIVLGDDGIRARKPEKEAGEYALKLLGTDVGNTLYVGDSHVDAAFAENMGMDCILCEYGYEDKKELLSQKSIGIVAEFEKIIDYLV